MSNKYIKQILQLKTSGSFYMDREKEEKDLSVKERIDAFLEGRVGNFVFVPISFTVATLLGLFMGTKSEEKLIYTSIAKDRMRSPIDNKMGTNFKSDSRSTTWKPRIKQRLASNKILKEITEKELNKTFLKH